MNIEPRVGKSPQHLSKPMLNTLFSIINCIPNFIHEEYPQRYRIHGCTGWRSSSWIKDMEFIDKRNGNHGSKWWLIAGSTGWQSSSWTKLGIKLIMEKRVFTIGLLKCCGECPTIGSMFMTFIYSKVLACLSCNIDFSD